MSRATATTDAHVPETSRSAASAPLLDHAYDGIREYDNPLPGWWRAIFWASIVFAAGYWIWFHVADKGASNDDRYRAALAEYESKRDLRTAKDAANVSEDGLQRGARDSSLVQRGATVFAGRCASCHADRGQGLIGPNLTDLHQLHGSTRMDLYQTVSRGVPGTAMLAWSEQMAATDVIAVTAFVMTLRGNPVTGKEPQGAPVTRFEP